MNLSKDSIPNNEQPVVNMQNEPNEPVVNISKEPQAQQNNQPNIMDENYNPLEGKVDMEKVHSTEAQVNQTINDSIGGAVNQAEEFLGKVSNGFNNFVDSLDKPKNAQNPYGNATNGAAMGAGMNMGQPNMGQPNMNMNMSNMVTPNQLKVEPVVACILSVLLVGLGQMINGQIGKGLTLLFGGMAAVFVVTLVTCGIGAVLAPVPMIIAAIDAYKCAQILQSGRPIGKWEFHILN